jgi:hypothetical protein
MTACTGPISDVVCRVYQGCCVSLLGMCLRVPVFESQGVESQQPLTLRSVLCHSYNEGVAAGRQQVLQLCQQQEQQQQHQIL